MLPIEVFADVVCPFTHVGLRRLSEARHERQVHPALVVRAWPLEFVNGAPLDPDFAAHEIDALRASVAPDLFSGFDAATFPRTSIPAFGLVAAAYRVDDATGAAISLAVRDALFEHGLDISDADVLSEIGMRFEVEPLDDVAAQAAVRADWDLGRARGVQGSPHFFVGDRDWFCPNLAINHEGDRFDIRISDETMRDFYATALAGA